MPEQAPEHAKPTATYVVGTLFAILVIGWLSIVTQPATLVSTAWWPVAGVALGLGIRYPRRYAWALAVPVGVITLAVALWAGRPGPLATALSVAAGIEMVVGTLILRGRRDVTPALSSLRDIGRLLIAIAAAAVVYDLLSAGAALALGDPEEAWTRLVTAAPKHAAGMLLLTPLFMIHPPRPWRVPRLEVILQITVTLAVAVFVFIISAAQLPVAFLAFLPLVWAALRMPTRLMLTETLAIAVIASFGSALGSGPFSFERLTPKTGSIVLQTFELSMVIVFLALSLAVGQERGTAQRLQDSEELFRRVFDASVAGELIVIHGADGWTVQRSNASAAALLPGLVAGQTQLHSLMGEEASEAVSRSAVDLRDGHALLTVTTDAGRILYISMVPINPGWDGRVLTLQFHDITETTRARRLEREELERAGQVQRALMPDQLPQLSGWSSGAMSVPAKQVGGDFYDLRFNTPHAVLSLGDVMGKGIAAGMLAVAARTALRANDLEMNPSAAVTRAAGILDGDLRRTSAFITLSYVYLNLVSGDYQVADAGHGLHFIVRGGSKTVEHITTDDMPVGLGDDWHEQRGTLAPGDAVLLVSDGVLDLWGGTVERLHKAVVRCTREVCDGPQAFVEALCTGADASDDRDDVTAVMLRRDDVENAPATAM